MPKANSFSSPGRLYKEIKVSRREFTDLEDEPLVGLEHPFVVVCKELHKRFSVLGKGAKFNEQTQESVQFLGWDLGPEQLDASTKVVAVSALIASFFATIVLVFFVPFVTEFLAAYTGGNFLMNVLMVLGPLVLLSLMGINSFQSFPVSESKREQVRALTYVPDIISYLTMSMKLVPNLEKAIEFAAEHGKGKIADDFKKLIWDVQIGVYNTLSEGLDELAYNWGKFSSEFKESLMMIRASVLESDEGKRYVLLDKTMENTLASIKIKMENYARSLSQPTTIMFYLGVLLPLILIIVLPVGAAFSGQSLAQPAILILIYNILIPGATVFFAFIILSTKPPTYDPPKIPDNHPDLFGKWKMKLQGKIFDLRQVLAVVLVVGLALSFALSIQGLPPKFMLEPGQGQILPADRSEAEILLANNKAEKEFREDGPRFARYLSMRRYKATTEEQIKKQRGLVMEQVRQEELIFFMRPENDKSPFALLFGLMTTISIVAGLYLYYSSIYKKKIQDKFVQMESEFKDSLYVLASRMGENKPVETALKHTMDFLPDYLISEKVFGRTLDNISLLGLPLEQALFDPSYGALKDNPSDMIRGGMKLLVDSVQLGVNVAARTLISLSMQLNNSEKVKNMLSTLVSDMTATMKSMAVFIAPVVLGITTSLQKVVILTLYQIASSGALTDAADAISKTDSFGIGLGSISQATSTFNVDAAVLAAMASPLQFLLIVGFYVAEMVVVMVVFTTLIEEDNDLKARLNLSWALPVATIVFLATAFLANLMVGGFIV